MPARAKHDVESTRGRQHPKEDEKPPSRGPRRIAKRLSVFAVALAAAALATAFVVPGPTGPAAPGSIMAHNSHGGPFTIGSSCTHYPGAEVAIRVPGPGTVVVSATVGVGIGHEFGVADEARIVVASSTTDCALTNFTAFVSVPPTLPTDSFHFVTVPLLRPFPVTGPSTATVYVNGIMASGADPGDRFDSASLSAVYYPS